MQKTVLQIPMNTQLKRDAENVAFAQGFSSLQEAVRLFLTKLAEKRIELTFQETVRLSPRAIKRYDKMIDDIESGRVKTKTFLDVPSLMKDLNR